MQASQAAELRRIWEEKGPPLCDHPKVVKEYYLSADTGDNVCTICGHAAPSAEFPRR